MRVAPATRWSCLRDTGRRHLGGSTAAAGAVGGGASVCSGGRAALGWQLITQADVLVCRCLLPCRAGRSELKAGALTLGSQATCSPHSALVLSMSCRSRSVAGSGASPLTRTKTDLRWAHSQLWDRQFTSTHKLETVGFALCMGTGWGQAGVQVRGLAYLSSGVRMTETPDPANCASCPENYYSACPVQGTNGPCDKQSTVPGTEGPGPAPRIRPSLGHLLHPTPTPCPGPHPNPLWRRQERWQVPAHPARPTGSSQPFLLPQGSWPRLREMLLSASIKEVMAHVCAGEWGRR